MKKPLKILSYIFIIIILLFIIIFRHTTKPTEYSKSRLYKKTKSQFAALQLQVEFNNSDTIKAGWCKVNIEPSKPKRLVGYGPRGNFTGVLDSVYVRTIVFKNNKHSVAYISYDLMIISRDVAKAVRKKLKESDLKVENIYFSSVHTHTSYGSWAKAFGMQILYGKYDKKLVNTLAEKTLKSIEISLKKSEQISFGYDEIPLSKTVRNDFGKKLYTDSILRVIKIKNRSGKSAFLSSFSAHPTYLSDKYTELSGDYPGIMNSLIEKEDTNYFSLFSAGAVACHKVVLKFPTNDSIYSYRSHKDAKAYANFLAKQILKKNDSTPTQISNKLDFKNIPIILSKPQARISKYLSLRAWVIYFLTGKPEPFLSYFRLGDIVFIGNPCDISGEFYTNFNSILHQKHIHLILTSFNGEYIGYTIPDYHYDVNESEAKEMNWYRAGSHFVFMIKSILNKIQ